MIHSPSLTALGWSGLVGQPLAAIVQVIRSVACPKGSNYRDSPAARGQLQASPCCYIVKLGGLLEMRRITRLNLRRKENRLAAL